MSDALKAIAAEGAALEASMPAAPGDPGAAPAGPPMDADTREALEWAAVPATAGGILSMAMPELAEVYTEDACLNWGRAMVPVARKYGWHADSLLGVWGPLLFASYSLMAPTVMAVKKRMDAAKAAKAAAARQPEKKQAEQPHQREPEMNVNAGVV